MKILMVTSEIGTIAKTGGLADMVAALTRTLAANGHDVRVVMPRYRFIRRETMAGHETPLGVPMGTSERWCAVYETKLGPETHPSPGLGPIPRATVYTIEHDALYDRDGVYGTRSVPFFEDNALRFALLSRAAFQLCRALHWIPDVIHCHDWPTALVPVYARTLENRTEFDSTATFFTIHNLGYQGQFSAADAIELGIPAHDLEKAGVIVPTGLNFLRGAIKSADCVTTVSEGYAAEITTPEFGFGLDAEIRARGDGVRGIVNGIDYDEWNPSTDPYITPRFDSDSLDRKAEAKRSLQTEFNLPVDNATAVVGIVSRLAVQKGFTALCGPNGALRRIADEMPVQIVIVGTGEEWIERDLEQLSAARANVAVTIGFDERLAHIVEAGADFFLMPSQYEPCGLNQMYSLRYGTIPIVAPNGGLKDTVKQLDPATTTGTGFFITTLDSDGILDAVRHAVELRSVSPDAIDKIRLAGMAERFTWQSSMEKYIAAYEATAARVRAAGRDGISP